MAAVTIGWTACSSENKSGCLLESPMDPPVLVAKSAAVTIREVRVISRKGLAHAQRARDPAEPRSLPRRVYRRRRELQRIVPSPGRLQGSVEDLAQIGRAHV